MGVAQAAVTRTPVPRRNSCQKNPTTDALSSKKPTGSYIGNISTQVSFTLIILSVFQKQLLENIYSLYTRVLTFSSKLRAIQKMDQKEEKK